MPRGLLTKSAAPSRHPLRVPRPGLHKAAFHARPWQSAPAEANPKTYDARLLVGPPAESIDLYEALRLGGPGNRR